MSAGAYEDGPAAAPGAAVRLAVVGHTNTGKTSLLRTLARDAHFGEVSDRPSTTRRVEGIGLLVDGREVVRLLDTPGLEDPIGLLETLDAIGRGTGGADLGGKSRGSPAGAE